MGGRQLDSSPPPPQGREDSHTASETALCPENAHPNLHAKGARSPSTVTSKWGGVDIELMPGQPQRKPAFPSTPVPPPNRGTHTPPGPPVFRLLVFGPSSAEGGRREKPGQEVRGLARGQLLPAGLSERHRVMACDKSHFCHPFLRTCPHALPRNRASAHRGEPPGGEPPTPGHLRVCLRARGVAVFAPWTKRGQCGWKKTVCDMYVIEQ